ncbi:uncharacterized protein LOC105437990 [Strongylocentrotus purpuratus]|uniref:Structure-specific endonuclease subunit SLX4 n=1 Tax=Strongylocentrotus purpuratus TaxID=7668 RepID=A0A7M7NGJ3_STRPU|nr:uncharacterized protein LOC105437990 [Strongylocentrotus purpuratus]
MTVQCLAELAEEGLLDSTSMSSDKCGFIPQETAHRVDSPENRLSDDQLTLLEDLSSLVNSPTMSDAVIQIDDGSKLHVHSFMIQLRCPALATLLAKPFGRKSTGLPSIVVSDMGYEAMENVLSYIYSATVNITNDTAVETHKFAERFEMADLASHCKPYLQDDTDSKITRKESELDIVDKDLNQLIDSLWEDEEDDKEEKNRDAGRTSDDDVNDALDDDEIKEIYESSQRFRTIMLEDEELEDDSPFREFVHSSVSSPKNIENDGERMMDEEEKEEEELHKMMLTQGCRRGNTSSYCSRDNSNSDGDNEDWSMAIDDEVVVQGEVNAQCVTPLAKRTTDERKDMIGENLNECTEDIVDETPKETYHSRRRVSVSSSSTNETITDEHHHMSFEESHHSFLNQTLVCESNVSAISVTDRQKKRKASPETSNISKGGSMGLECGDGVKVLHKRFLDAGVEHSESPDDEVLFLRMDSAESESDGQNRTLEKSLQSVRETSLQVENSTGLNGKVQDRGFDDIDQGRLSSSRKKKLLIQQYSPQTDSDDNRSPPEQVASHDGNEIQVVRIKESESGEIIDKIHRNSSVVLKKLSMTLKCNKLDKDGESRQKRLASQSSTENHDDRGFKKRQGSLDWSLSEDILSPSPPPSPKFSKASQIPRLEKMVESKRGPVSRNNHLGLDHSRSLKASPKIKAESLEEEEEDDPYQLSPSSSTSSRKGSKHPSSSKRKKKMRVKRETPQRGNGSSLSSPSFESSASSKDTNRRWSSLKMDQDLPSCRSRDSFHCEASPELMHDLSPSTSPPVLHRISPSPSFERSPPPGASSVPLHRISLSPSMERSSAPGASPVPGASPAVSTSPSVSSRQSPYPAMQDMDEEPEERFAYDMEEGCGYNDFHVGMDHPNDEDDDSDAGIAHQNEKSVKDGEGSHRIGEISEGIMTGSHQNEHFEEENEIDLTHEEEEKEDRLMDDVHLPSSAFRDRSRDGSGFPMQVGHKEPEQKDEYNNIGTPHVKHYQRPLLGGGPGDGPKGHRLSQSLTTTPRTSQSNAVSTGAVLKTPSISRLIRDEYYPPAPITPMPNYDSMMTPELKKELKRYGVKPLGKKKAKLLLSEIYSYLHQVMPGDESDEDTSSTAMTKAEPEPSKGRSKKGKATTKQKPATKRGKAQPKPREESSSDDRQFKETNNKKSNIQKKQTKPRKRKKAEGCLDETPTKRVKTEIPLKERILDTARRGVETEDSTGLDEPVSSQGSHSSSIDSNKSDFGESIYYEDMEDEDDDVMETQQEQDMSTEVKRYIMRNKELHQKILHYEALNLEEFYKELKEAKVQCSKVKLVEFLDHQCITFRGQGGSRQRKPKNTKTKTKTKR